MQWHSCPLQSAWEQMGSSMTPYCPFSQEVLEKGNDAMGNSMLEQVG